MLLLFNIESEDNQPILPLIFVGAISARYIGPTHRPKPEAMPIKNLTMSAETSKQG